MKKILFIIPLLLINLSIVKADTINFDYSFHYTDFTEQQLSDMIEAKRLELINYWQHNYSSEYPYYYIAFDNAIPNASNNSRLDLLLIYSSSIPSSEILNPFGIPNVGSHAITVSIFCNSNAVQCHSSPVSSSTIRYVFPLFYSNNTSNGTIYRFYPFSYYDSNFTLNFNLSDTYNVIKNNEIIYSYSNGDVVPTYRSENIIPQIYTEINLNDYEYIILSLKDYSLRNNDNNQFYTDIYTKGQLCLTPVYNYGMTPKSDYYTGYQVQSCTSYYNDFTPISTFILKQDLENYAVYYIKSPNYSTTNIIKVDTSIFDITYITSQNVSNPSVVIDNRSYPVIPYDDLTDTAIISTNEGYISGKSCALGDINCNYEDTIGFDITDLFTQPLKVLQNVWASITSVFALITSFILLIPSPLKEFLISAFMLSVLLGILKIIL